MNRKPASGFFRWLPGTLSFVALLCGSPAHAALLGVSPTYPAIDHGNTSVVYNWDDIGNTGGTLSISGNYGGNAIQSISFAGEQAHYLTSTLGGGPGLTGYSLVANFDATGAFTGGSMSVTGYVSPYNTSNVIDGITPPSGWANSGTILTGTLTDFGFLGTSTATSGIDNLRLDFALVVTGGDLFGIDYTSGGVTFGGNVNNGLGISDWDNLANPLSAFQRDFASCGSGCPGATATYVPIPAAAWLFGSGLIGIGGVFSRKQRVRS